MYIYIYIYFFFLYTYIYIYLLVCCTIKIYLTVPIPCAYIFYRLLPATATSFTVPKFYRGLIYRPLPTFTVGDCLYNRAHSQINQLYI